MAIRSILHYPDKRLRTPGKPVENFDADFHKLVDDMAETMYAAPGVGLAAPQIGVSLRLFLVDISMEDEKSDLKVFVNPEFVSKQGSICWEEGCLSFPSIREEIERAEHIKVKAQDKFGKWFELEADGLLSIAIQHEYDHIEGRLMIDHLSALRRRFVHRNMVKRAAVSYTA